MSPEERYHRDVMFRSLVVTDIEGVSLDPEQVAAVQEFLTDELPSMEADVFWLVEHGGFVLQRRDGPEPQTFIKFDGIAWQLVCAHDFLSKPGLAYEYVCVLINGSAVGAWPDEGTAGGVLHVMRRLDATGEGKWMPDLLDCGWLSEEGVIQAVPLSFDGTSWLIGGEPLRKEQEALIEAARRYFREKIK